MDNEQRAIQLIKMASDMSFKYYEKPLVCTYSGGKDSDVLLELHKRAGVPFEVHNSHTTADAPQTVYHIRKKFKQLEEQGIKCTIQMPEMSMWKLIVHKGFPPTRIARYCCAYLKETSCENSMISTGVRWDESNARKERGPLEIITPKKKDRIVLSHNEIYETKPKYRQISLFEEEHKEVMLMSDNSKKRKLLERCQLKAKSVCNPIVDWTTSELWNYINQEHIEVNELYYCGFSRVGCIGCPMADKKRYFEFSVFPKYEMAYRNAFQRMVEKSKVSGNKKCRWKNGNEVFLWWMQEGGIPGQYEIKDLENY